MMLSVLYWYCTLLKYTSTVYWYHLLVSYKLYHKPMSCDGTIGWFVGFVLSIIVILLFGCRWYFPGIDIVAKINKGAFIISCH